MSSIYKISNAQLTKNATRISEMIDLLNECSLSSLQNSLKMDDKTFYLSLGWLIKANKVFVFEEFGDERVCLIQ
jgi:hypothetical protein